MSLNSSWREIYNARIEDIKDTVNAFYTLVINTLYEDKDFVQVAKWRTELQGLNDILDMHKMYQLEFRTMRCVENGFEYKEVLCPCCGHKFGSILENKFFEGGQTNCCPDCGRSFDWGWIDNE